MDYISGWCKSKRRLEGLTAIVTGSNTGIGKETALDFYMRGARVIMACRDTTKAESAKKEIENAKEGVEGIGTLVVEELNLSQLKSVREFAFRILAKESNINILVNNAGVMCCPEGRTEDGFETHMGTNHFGHALLTLLLLPRLKKSAPSRIVFVSSLMHKSNDVDLDDINFEKKRYDALDAYSRSKGANVLYAKALGIKLKEHNINNVMTYSLHPGVINTEIGRHFSDTLLTGGTWLFKYIIGFFAKTPRCGAQTTIYCSVDESCAEQSGLYYADCRVAPTSKQCKDEEIPAKFFDITTELLKLKKYDPFGDKDPERSLFEE
ncbi:retinol dehydrogenase 11-like isoform X2 [Hyposmocoma kahamanoa]|uniref:retinol dehydrogenase 11-like isoform X2 n=1 Tax=Hyposmocoma kahamanoa TaxID=1477025 RepID=UPI000E6D759C|nr:retinol dehydrogenase 11-like isoform X2 [Hyposmocoma kahamanoa]